MPQGYSWRDGADADPDQSWTGYTAWGAVNVWGQAFATTDPSSYGARLQVRNPRLRFLIGGAWQQAAFTPGSMSGAYYPGDFQSGSVNGTSRQDSPGVWSMPLGPLDGEPDALHWWWDGMYPRVPIPANADGILASQDARLIEGSSTLIASTGVDLFATPGTVVHPQGWNPGIPNPRMKYVTTEWQTFYVTTLGRDALTSNPPPE